MDGARLIECIVGLIAALLTIVLTVHAVTGWDALSWVSWALGALLVLIYGVGVSWAMWRAYKPHLDHLDPMAHPYGDQPFTPKPLKRRSF
jgi:protein-S-isoprenylcysteine O-methyltransferase Ste14